MGVGYRDLFLGAREKSNKYKQTDKKKKQGGEMAIDIKLPATSV